MFGRIASRGLEPHPAVPEAECGMVTDCQSVVSYAKSPSLQQAGSAPFAGFWRKGQAALLSGFGKIKSHLTVEAASARGMGAWWLGNDLADKAAKDALPRVVPDPRDWLRLVKEVGDRLRAPLRAIFELHLWDTMCRQKPAHRLRTTREPRPNTHSFVWLSRRWVCRFCGGRKKHRKGPIDKLPCAGLLRLADGVHESHSLFIGHVDHGTSVSPILFCFDCGRYGCSKLVGLRRRCPGRPLSGWASLKRLRGAAHPVSQLPILGIRRVRPPCLHPKVCVPAAALSLPPPLPMPPEANDPWDDGPGLPPEANDPWADGPGSLADFGLGDFEP